eukprot:XP_001704337.1 Hypothetical protein GL50803_32775 [Giardia lamblia ATCC 50803]
MHFLYLLEAQTALVAYVHRPIFEILVELLDGQFVVLREFHHFPLFGWEMRTLDNLHMKNYVSVNVQDGGVLTVC